MSRPGQTVLELVLATGVIIISVVSATTLIISTITVGRVSQNRIEAANLARAGVEIVRGIRDSNWHKRAANIVDFHPTNPTDRLTVNWDDRGSIIDGYQPLGAAAAITYRAVFDATTGRWSMQSAAPAVSQCDSTTTPNYFRIWTATAGTARYLTQGCVVAGPVTNCQTTRYCERISIAKVTQSIYPNPNYSGLSLQADYLRVIATISWPDRTGTKTLVAEEQLYDWQ